MLLTFAKLLEITEEKARGPATTFEEAHVLLVFVTIGDDETIGRGILALRSGLGEGAIRTILKRLRRDGYVDANASGCYLTPAGRRVYESVRRKLSRIVSIQSLGPSVGSVRFGLSVRGGGRAVKLGIEQRDSAVRVGASGALTYVIKKGKFTIPSGSVDCEKDFPGETWRELREKLSPREGDAVVLCGANEDARAKVGLLSAAITLLQRAASLASARA